MYRLQSKPTARGGPKRDFNNDTSWSSRSEYLPQTVTLSLNGKILRLSLSHSLENLSQHAGKLLPNTHTNNVCQVYLVVFELLCFFKLTAPRVCSLPPLVVVSCERFMTAANVFFFKTTMCIRESLTLF